MTASVLPFVMLSLIVAALSVHQIRVSCPIGSLVSNIFVGE